MVQQDHLVLSLGWSEQTVSTEIPIIASQVKTASHVQTIAK